MSNLMLFVEENLLYHLEKCYDKDYYIPKADNDKTCEKYLINTPLILPHSTLPEQSSKMLHCSSFCDDFTELLQNNSNRNPFLNVHNQKIECNDWENVQAGIKMSSNNPFLETTNNQTECNNTLSPEMFMQILKKNEKFQKQILSIFSFLIVKLSSVFVEDNDCSLESKLKKSYEERLLYASEFLENIILKEDISSLLIPKPTNCSNNITIDSRPDQSNGIFMSLFTNNNNYVANGKSEVNSNNERVIIDSFQEKSAMTESKTKTAAFPYQIDFFLLYKEEIADNKFNETNPFKIILKLKECEDLSAVKVEYDNSDLKKYNLSDYTNFDQNRTEMNNTHDHESTQRNNDYTSFTSKFKYDSSHSEHLSTDNSKQYETSNMNLGKSLFSGNNYFQSSNTYSTPLRDNKTEQLINSTFLFPLNNSLISDEYRFDKTNFKSNSEICSNMSNEGCIEELKVNSLQESYILGETLREDVGKTILSQVNVPNESSVNQLFLESIGMLNTNRQYQATEIFPNNYNKTITNFDLKFTRFPYREYTNNDEKNVNRATENDIDFQSYFYNGTFVPNTNTTDLNHREVDIENEHNIQNIYVMEELARNKINFSWYKSIVKIDNVLTILYFRTIEINKSKFCIFHLENKGWILVNDFVKEFTNYKTIPEFYEQLPNYTTTVNFKEIKILKGRTIFFQCTKVFSNMLEDKINKNGNIYLMPLKSITTWLLVLRIITHKDINNIRENGTYFQGNPSVCKALVLNKFYEELKHFTPKMTL
ncbi:hypothetical protein M0802_015238 [Mischocyttarus mexicanus]|nr:hypothetical protein M0802_015238 [Mischocyttarus mexicanus]